MRFRGRRAPDLHSVYRENVGAVFAFFSYSAARATAEDLTSLTFERVVRAWGRYDAERASPRTWIMSIARNVLVDYYRSRESRRHTSLDAHPGLIDAMTHDDGPFTQVLAADELRVLMAVLGDREREILALRYGADLAAKDIADLLGLTAPNVHQIVSRSLRLLREQTLPVPVSDSAARAGAGTGDGP